MTIILDLPASVEDALTQEADRRGITPQSLVLDDLQRLYPSRKAGSAAQQKTGADIIAIWEKEGAFLAREDLPDSPELARQIREKAQHARDYLWDQP
jgi:hypothetical protein